VFLLVLAHPGSPGQRAIKTVVVVVVVVLSRVDSLKCSLLLAVILLLLTVM